MFKIKYFLIGIGLMLTSNIILAQRDSIAFAAADTSKFSPNKAKGWQLFNSYVSTYKSDSATLELIIQHANNINWISEQLVGSISYSVLIPREEQNIPFKLLTNNYMLRIDTKGRCFIRLVSGDYPTDNPLVIPLKIFYKP